MKDAKQIRDTLLKEFQTAFPNNTAYRFFYAFSHGRSEDRKIYAKCKYCSNLLSWNIQIAGNYKLGRWSNEHNHRDNEALEEAIFDFLTKLPRDSLYDEIKKQVMENF